MRSEFSKCGIIIKKSHAYLDIHNMFNKVEVIGILDIFEKEIKAVIYPLENPSIFLHDIILLIKIENPKYMFEFSHFINSSNLSSNQIASVMNIL